MTAAEAAKRELEAIIKQAMRAGELWKDEGAGALVVPAHEAWMRARAAEGDRFALSLGYTRDGWDYDTWIRRHEAKAQ